MTRFLLLLLTGCDLTTAIAGPPFEVGDPDAELAALASDDDASEASADSAFEADADASVDTAPPVHADAAVDSTPPAIDSSAPLDGELGCDASARCGALIMTTPNEICVTLSDGGLMPMTAPPQCAACSSYSCACIIPALGCTGSCVDPAGGARGVHVTCQ